MQKGFQCEICGNWTDGRSYRVIEGVKMIVCDKCKGFGEKIKRKSYSSNISINSSIVSRSQRGNYNYRNKSHRIRYPKRNPSIEELQLVDDYRKIIKQKRQELNLIKSKFAQSIGITEASYRSIESGKIDLLIKDALKIEKKYKIKLTETSSNDEEYDPAKLKTKSNELTLADVFFKKKKRKTE
ncbi:MAG: helix-turn-helix domain-containing protein [Promethearchaeota archaeon]